VPTSTSAAIVGCDGSLPSRRDATTMPSSLNVWLVIATSETTCAAIVIGPTPVISPNAGRRLRTRGGPGWLIG
jgi:hypothetical protein